eukprot:gene7505-15359_t
MNKSAPQWIQKMISICTIEDIGFRSQFRPTLHIISSESTVKKAAVLVPICYRHGIPSILFTLRTNLVGSHKGEVSFPGGHLEAAEDAIAAALRETREELGIGIGEITIIGKCGTLPAKTGTLVTPIIGFVCDDVTDFENLQPSEYEVAKIFTRPIDLLLDPTYRRSDKINFKGQEYILPYFGEKDSDECIWGLTAIILDTVLEERTSKDPRTKRHQNSSNGILNSAVVVTHLPKLYWKGTKVELQMQGMEKVINGMTNYLHIKQTRQELHSNQQTHCDNQEAPKTVKASTSEWLTWNKKGKGIKVVSTPTVISTAADPLKLAEPLIRL